MTAMEAFETALNEHDAIGTAEDARSWNDKWGCVTGVFRLARAALAEQAATIAEQKEQCDFNWQMYLEAKGWLVACAKALNYGGSRKDETLARYENMAAYCERLYASVAELTRQRDEAREQGIRNVADYVQAVWPATAAVIRDTFNISEGKP